MSIPRRHRCRLCNEAFETPRGLSQHIRHMNDCDNFYQENGYTNPAAKLPRMFVPRSNHEDMNIFPEADHSSSSEEGTEGTDEEPDELSETEDDMEDEEDDRRTDIDEEEADDQYDGYSSEEGADIEYLVNEFEVTLAMQEEMGMNKMIHTKEETVMVALLTELEEMGCSLKAYDRVMNWAVDAFKNKYEFPPEYPKRTSFVLYLLKKFKMEDQLPKIVTVALEGDRPSHIDVIHMDFKSLVLSLLTDTELMVK